MRCVQWAWLLAIMIAANSTSAKTADNWDDGWAYFKADDEDGDGRLDSLTTASTAASNSTCPNDLDHQGSPCLCVGEEDGSDWEDEKVTHPFGDDESFLDDFSNMFQTDDTEIYDIIPEFILMLSTPSCYCGGGCGKEMDCGMVTHDDGVIIMALPNPGDSGIFRIDQELATPGTRNLGYIEHYACQWESCAICTLVAAGPKCVGNLHSVNCKVTECGHRTCKGGPHDRLSCGKFNCVAGHAVAACGCCTCSEAPHAETTCTCRYICKHNNDTRDCGHPKCDTGDHSAKKCGDHFNCTYPGNKCITCSAASCRFCVPNGSVANMILLENHRNETGHQ